MPYTISITDDRTRDAAIEAISPRRQNQVAGYRTADGRIPQHTRLIKATEHTALSALLKQHNDDLDAVGQALIDGDPEIPLHQLGGRMDQAARVYLKQDGSVLYAARVLRVSEDPDGVELSREDFVDIEATVGGEAAALPWTGRLLDPADVIKRFALVRKLQLRHVNGLTFDFLYEIAKQLHESGKILQMGSGKKGGRPLIFTKNGSPYHGFLEGRIDGDAFRLVLHLSNMELKKPAPKEGDK